MEINLPKILVLAGLLFVAYKIITTPAVFNCLQWTWRIICLAGLVLALAAGGLTGEEIIPILGFFVGEGAFAGLKAISFSRKNKEIN